MAEPILEKSYEVDVEKYVRSGGIHARLYIELHSTDKELAQQVLEKAAFRDLEAIEGLEPVRVRLYPLEEADGSFSGVIEAEVVTRDFKSLVAAVVRYGPTAIEVIEPTSIKLDLEEMQNLLVELSLVSQAYSTKILQLLDEKGKRAIYRRLLE